MQFFRGSGNDPSNHLESDGRFSDRPRGGFSLETQTVMEPAVLEFWLGYLDRLPPDLDHPPKAASVFSFGKDKGGRKLTVNEARPKDDRGGTLLLVSSTGATASHHCKVSSVAPFRLVG